MNTSDSFTAAFLRVLLCDPTMPETVLQWVRMDSDAERRTLKFAAQLCEDFIARFNVAADDMESELMGTLLRMAIDRANWHRIAARLLQVFTTPERLASPVRRRHVSFLEPVAGFSLN